MLLGVTGCSGGLVRSERLYEHGHHLPHAMPAMATPMIATPSLVASPTEEIPYGIVPSEAVPDTTLVGPVAPPPDNQKERSAHAVAPVSQEVDLQSRCSIPAPIALAASALGFQRPGPETPFQAPHSRFHPVPTRPVFAPRGGLLPTEPIVNQHSLPNSGIQPPETTVPAPAALPNQAEPAPLQKPEPNEPAPPQIEFGERGRLTARPPNAVRRETEPAVQASSEGHSARLPVNPLR